ncbi:MAG: DNA polymerase III subunit gamma/tau [Rhizobacter sp.]
MSYIVLARKYRSRDFEALVGQEHVVKALTNALTQQRLHHAYLFTGTRGVGKTSVARILAKALNCTGPDGQGGITAHPCGVCSACRDIDSGRFVDYVELDAASNRGVEEISQLLDQAVYKPVIGRFKVYLIDEVHMLSNTAFNAMLKTLEEPPEYLKFVLATTDPQKVPPTVLSRCLQFNLRPMAPQTVQEHLSTVLAAEKIEAEPGALRLLARAARGSMRDALSLTDQAIAFGAGSLSETSVRQMLGAVDRSHAVRLVEALAAGQGAEVVAAVDGLRSLGLSATGTLEEMAALLQQMAVLQAVPDALDESNPDAPTAARLAGLLAADETQFLYSIVLHGRAELGLAPDEYSGLVMVLLRMLAFRPGGAGTSPQRVASPVVAKPAAAPVLNKSIAVPVRPAAVMPAPAARTRTPASAPASSEPPPWLEGPYEDESPAAPMVAREPEPVRLQVAAAAWAPTPEGDRWAEVVSQMVDAGSISALVRELAMQSQCLSVDDKAEPAVWRLRVERETLRATAQRDKLQAALSELLKRVVQLEVEHGAASDTPAQRAGAERARRQTEAEQIIHNDPLVQALMQQFKTARVVPGSVKPH